MCNFFSAIVTKTGQVYYDKDIDSHEELIKTHKLDDKQEPMLRNWCRIELLPPNERIADLKDFKPEEWKFKIDEPANVDWIEPKHEKACRKALQKCYKEYVVVKGKTENKKGRLLLLNNSRSENRDSSSSENWDSSSSENWDSSRSVNWDNSKSENRDNSSSENWDNSSSENRDNSSSENWDNSSSENRDNSSSENWNNSQTVISYLSSAKQENVELHDNSVLINHRDKIIVIPKSYKVEYHS